MKKYLIASILLLAVLFPVVSFAVGPYNEDDFDSDDNGSTCISLTYKLGRRAGPGFTPSRDSNTNGEVSLLKDFLQSEGYMSSEPTGYFGLVTFQAVKDFQRAYGLYTDGTVGLKTRIKINEVSCGGGSGGGGIGVFPPGCNSTEGYSTTTGKPCNEGTTLPPGCYPGYVYSATTGQKCDDNTGGGYPYPVVDSFSPNSGPVGTKVTIRGKGFNSFLKDFTNHQTLVYDANDLNNISKIAELKYVDIKRYLDIGKLKVVNDNLITFTIPNIPSGRYLLQANNTTFPPVSSDSNYSGGILFKVTSGSFPPGCTSSDGYSTTTGKKCDGSDEGSSTLKTSIISGNKSVFAPGETISLKIKGTEVFDGSSAESREGFRMQIHINGPDATGDFIGAALVAEDAYYNSNTRYWEIQLPVPSDSSKRYRVRAILFCNDESSICGPRYARGGGSDSGIDYFDFSISTSQSDYDISIAGVSGNPVTYDAGAKAVTIGEFNIYAHKVVDITDINFLDYVYDGAKNQSYDLNYFANFQNFSLWVNGVLISRSGTIESGQLIFRGSHFKLNGNSSNPRTKVVLQADIKSAASGASALQIAGLSGASIKGWGSEPIYNYRSYPVKIAQVAQPSITVISPNGGEKCTVGSTCRISWTYNAINPVPDAKMQLVLLKNGREIYEPFNIKLSYIRDSYYDWKVYDGVDNGEITSGGNDYKIRATIYNYDTGLRQAVDESNAPFTILPKTPTASTFSISGKIVQSNGTPAPATVSAGGIVTSTDANGRYSVTGITTTSPGVTLGTYGPTVKIDVYLNNASNISSTWYAGAAVGTNTDFGTFTMPSN